VRRPNDGRTGLVAKRGLRIAALGPLLAALLLGLSPAPFDPMNARDATTLPRSLGAHPGAAIEWWYVTGILGAESGAPLGFELALFRARIGGAAPEPGSKVSAWRPGDLYFGHYAITDPAKRLFRYDERASRTAVGLAGADSTDLDVWVGDWSLRRDVNGAMHLRASGQVGALDLDLGPARGLPVAWGPDYISYKDAARRTFSRYQTYPSLAASGRYATAGGLPRSVRGQAWFDHEWSDGRADSSLRGWDWFGLRVADGRSVMIYRMRGRNGKTVHLFAGVDGPDGRVRAYGSGDVTMTAFRTWVSPRSGARYPVAWRILIAPPGERPMEIQVSAALADQELDTRSSTQVIYWEGMVTGRLKEDEGHLPVEGYLELTGYAGGGWPGRLEDGPAP
jgi:predicted secreted hydrolase